MKALTLLIGAALLTSVAGIAQTYVQPVRLQLVPLLPLGPLFQPQTTVAAGSTFSVALYADSATQYVNLYGYQFNLKFDSTKLQALEVKEGADFQNTGVSDFVPGFIVNPSGEIKTSFDSLQGKTAAVSVSGLRTLAVIQFKALQTGSAAISLAYPVLVDQAGVRVPLTFAPLTVTVR